MTKEKQPIPPENQKAYIEKIQYRAVKQNGGFTRHAAQGGYLAKDGSMIYEPILIIETYGDSLFTDSELSNFCKLLNQEVLFVHESGISRAYLYDGEIEDDSNFYQEVIPEGDIIRYYKEPVPYGQGYKILCEITDAAGTPIYAGYVDESDLCSASYYENQTILNMMAHFKISH
jgi:hypothetical protein